ncbi:MAG: lipoyl domain-containing protein, partial [Nitrospinota bacterium]
MATPLPMPKLGLTMEEGTILKWFKPEGSPVKKGEIILQIQTDKVEYEVESPDGGVLLKTLAGEGAVVPCGTNIAVIGKKGEDVSAFAGAAPPAPKTPAPAAPAKPAAPPAPAPAAGGAPAAGRTPAPRATAACSPARPPAGWPGSSGWTT